MKLREIVVYELEYRFRSPSTWIYAGVLFFVAVWISLATGADGDGGVHANAPERLAGVSVLIGMLGMLVTAALFADAAVRDVEVGMDPLLFTCPIGKAEYLGGRFLGALAVNAAILVVIPLAFLVMTGLLTYLAPEVVGPLSAFAYLQPLLLFSLPNLILVGAILFTIAMLARHVVPVYLGALGILVGYVVALNYANQIESAVLAALVDPLGQVTLERLTEYWTTAERNARLIGLPAALAWNRALWLAVAAAALALLHRSFRFAHGEGGGGRRRWRRSVEVVPPLALERSGAVAVPRVAGSFGVRTSVQQTLAVARTSLSEFAASRWFIVVLLACVGLPVLWGWNVGDTVFETSTWPVTFLVAEVVLSGRFTPVIPLLITIYAGELVWRERDAGAAEIADAAPVSEGVALLGRFLALLALVAMFQAASIAGGTLIQALQGYYNFEIGLYLRVVFGLDFPDYALFAALAMTIHVIVNHKYLGHIAVLLAFASTKVLPALGLVEHHLLLYGTDPGWTYSDMNGFGPFVGPFVWFKLYWAAWALLLGVVSVLLWVRGREPGVGRRLLLARTRFGGPIARIAAAATVLVGVLGGFIFYNTNVLNPYRTAADLGAPQAEYEKRYKRFENAPQPTIVSAELHVELYPEEPAVDIRGTFHLVNRTDAAIDSVHVWLDPKILARSLSLGRSAEPAVTDAEVGYRIYALERAIEPGDSMQLAFDVSYRPRGFPNEGIQTDVTENGTYLDRRWMPFVGYQPMFELSDDEVRGRFGLDPRPALAGAGDEGARRYRQPWRDADLVHVSAVLGTSADQIAVTPGVLRRSWNEHGRRYFHYETEQPESFGASVFSGRFAAVEDRWQDVGLTLLHHPTHKYNLDRMARGLKAALDYLTTEFGRYPYSHLSVVEVPRYDTFGRAHPYTIAFSEDHFIRRVDRDDLDSPFFGAAHEVAHAWWGGQVRSAAGVRGQAVLSESLANYSAMMVTEHTYGLEAARRAYDYQMDRYLRQRAAMARDVPLLESVDQPWIFYGKGAVAMYLLRDYIGPDRVNTALRRFLEKYRDSGPPYPTSRDLYAELSAVTPDSLHGLLHDLFETITLWDVRAHRAAAEPTGTGGYVVMIDVVAKKMRADGEGDETEVPMDDLVDVAVFARGDGGAPGEPLYVQRHRIRSGEQTIRIVVPREPARAGIDPYRKLIDRQREDNIVEVTSAGTGGTRTRPGGRGSHRPATVSSPGTRARAH